MKIIYPNIIDVEITPKENNEHGLYVVMDNTPEAHDLYNQIGAGLRVVYAIEPITNFIFLNFILEGSMKEFFFKVTEDLSCFSMALKNNQIKFCLIVVKNEIGGSVPIGREVPLFF